jgi:hypothetical protein
MKVLLPQVAAVAVEHVMVDHIYALRPLTSAVALR